MNMYEMQMIDKNLNQENYQFRKEQLLELIKSNKKPIRK